MDNRTITKQKHPTLDLYVYNYSPEVQYSPELWDNETEICRGLIVSGGGEVVSRGFRKFFNLNTSYRPETHLTALPTDRPQVMEKMDGSLGILWEYGGQVGVATRGSFTSPQAEWATGWYASWDITAGGMEWPDGYTPLFEIIYPENRIVCRYNFSGLVLIGLINKTTGEELSYPSINAWATLNDLPIAKPYNKTLEETIADKGQGNDEGYVLTWFQPYLKVKVKFEEYCRLHRVLTGMNAKTVWEMLQTDEQRAELDGLLGDTTLPQEFRDWLWKTMTELLGDYTIIAITAKAWFNDRPEGDRKTVAQYFLANPYPHICFAMLDGKDYSRIIWKLLKPKAVQPFKEEV